MENIINRFCDYQKDHKKLMGFWLDYRAAFDVRMYPTIWRIRLLLTSRVWEQEKDTRIWENGSGQIIGFAMLWRRQPTSSYIVFDSFIHPKFVTNELLLKILQWGDQRTSEIAKEQKISLTVYASGFSQHSFSASALNQNGYILLPPNPDEHNVYFSKSLQNEISSPLLPAGHKIRQIQDIGELESYQALYGFSKVNLQHQKELIESDEYFHLVVVNPSGDFAAYCECSVSYLEWERTNHKIGWIDYVETRPEQQRKGLGKAILLAGLFQLQKLGAETAMLVTITTNTPAVNLYNKIGFDDVEILEYPSYQKQIAVPETTSNR
ncbi:MAG: GNAT family N-acetyltransferase [Anaerolineales bacterium]|nr:GNAT family N-acetyltransferase [Anaerolineales bacterium]